jgi:hypothetical protein
MDVVPLPVPQPNGNSGERQRTGEFNSIGRIQFHRRSQSAFERHDSSSIGIGRQEGPTEQRAEQRAFREKETGPTDPSRWTALKIAHATARRQSRPVRARNCHRDGRTKKRVSIFELEKILAALENSRIEFCTPTMIARHDQNFQTSVCRTD